jgi:hypothetical protein
VLRNALIDKDLVAFDGTRFQVLSLRARPLVRARPPLSSAGDRDDQDPATVRHLLVRALRRDTDLHDP